MNRGPAKNSRPADRSFVDKVREAYGEPADWLIELANLADRDGLAGAEKIIGYSRSAISNVLNNKYQKGDTGRVEQMVRGILMSETVDCPVLGAMARNVCLDWQKRPYTDASALHIRMHRACKVCPNSRQRKEDGDAD